MIGQQLQRDRVDDGCDQAVRVRHFDHLYAVFRLDTRLVVCEYVQLTAPRTHHLHVGFKLVEQLVVGRNDDHRHIFVDQREWTVL